MEINITKVNDDFLVDCSVRYNSIVSGFPERRFLSGLKKWKVPVIRKNVEFIQNFLKDANISDAARKTIDGFKQKEIKELEYYFKTKPMKQQEDALKNVGHLPFAALFMEMGTGKTKVAIDIMCAAYMAREIDVVFVISPLSIRSNWEEEIRIHGRNNNDVFHYSVKDHKKAQTFFGANFELTLKWVFAGVESLSAGRTADNIKALTVGKKYAVIVDESSKIKNHKAKRTIKATEIGEKAVRRLILTGTPMSQGPQDLYGQFFFLDKNIIGISSYFAFRNRYCVMGGFKNKMIVTYKNMEELLSDIKPYVFQCRKEEVLKEIPPKTYQIREIIPSADQQTVYTRLEKFGFITGEDDVVKNKLECTLRQKIITGGFLSEKYDNPDPIKRIKKPFLYRNTPMNKNPKMDELVDLMEEFDGSVIIYAEYIHEIVAINKTLSKIYGPESCVMFYGAIDEEGRKLARERFQKKQSRFFIANPATAGMGLTLTAATLVVYFSNTDRYEDRVQSEDRAHRKGQHNPVTYIDMIMKFKGVKRSVDQKNQEAHKRKMGLSEYVRAGLD